jgi:hypothetical protein
MFNSHGHVHPIDFEIREIGAVASSTITLWHVGLLHECNRRTHAVPESPDVQSQPPGWGGYINFVQVLIVDWLHGTTTN